MLFFTRAFLCIGTIVVLAEGVDPRGWFGAADPLIDKMSAVRPIEAWCRNEPKLCASALAAGASVMLPPAPPEPKGVEASGRPAVRHRGAELSLVRSAPK